MTPELTCNVTLVSQEALFKLRVEVVVLRFLAILRLYCFCIGTVCLTVDLSAQGQTNSSLESARQAMVQEAVVVAGVKNERVIQSLRDTLRHEFIGRQLRSKAYFDMALPIGARQTISSPFIVAYMTEALEPQPTDKILEIGTGSGYQAAVLSPLVDRVYTIEIVESLGRKAISTLKRLKYRNIFVKIGDGFKGWPDHAPFDKIIVTCSPESVPQPLIDQLKDGGRMVIPVGERFQQTLYLFTKQNGTLEPVALRPTLFVPMTGTAEDSREIQPDPTNPQILNGNFEEALPENGFVAGWYYQRQLTVETSPESDVGQFVTFQNEDPGRSAHLMQGFAIDGSAVAEVALSAKTRYERVYPGRNRTELPVIAISFYDANRKQLNAQWLGPFRGTAAWHETSKVFRVPTNAHTAILRIGLFGATGIASFDDIQLRSKPR